VAAIGPARNAVRIPPVAALGDRRPGGDVSLRRRFAGGTAVALAGAVLLAIGLAEPAIALVGVGAVAVFLGVAMLAPAIAGPLSSVLGRPLARLLREPGRLGRENSMRSPRRTAQTASALMVGLALVAAMSVFGASVSRSATSSADQAISADLIVTATGTGLGGTRRHADHHRLPVTVRVRGFARRAYRGIDRPSGRHGHPAHDGWFGRRAGAGRNAR
jgi:putative ABC transport system permease protein